MTKRSRKQSGQGEYIPHTYNRLMPWTWLTLLAVVVLLAGVIVVGFVDFGGPDADPEPPRQRVVLGEEVFQLELALTEASRRKGLMYRDALPDDGGMLFVFRTRKAQAMYMKDCLVPIDVLFIDDQGKIIIIHEMSVPAPNTPTSRLPNYRSVRPCQFAIELPGGTAARLGIAEGDRIDLPYEQLKQRAR